MELQVGVKVLLRNKEGKYLLLKRSDKYGSTAGLWDMPGGRIDPGVPLINNLKREIREEIGLEIDIDPKLIAAQDILHIKDLHIVRLTYLADVGKLTGIRLSEEHTEYNWFGKDELKNLDREAFLKEVINSKI